MRSDPLELIPERRLAPEKPGLCEIGLGAIGGLFGGGAAATGAAAAGTALSFGDVLSIGGTALSLAGTLSQASAERDQGAYYEALGRRQALIAEQRARRETAVGTRLQADQERRTKLAISRAQALSAASGGSATDPTVLGVVGRLAQQGELNALTELENAQARAADERYQGQIDLFQGRRARYASDIKANATVLTGLSSFATNKAILRYFSKTGTSPYGTGAI